MARTPKTGGFTDHEVQIALMTVALHTFTALVRKGVMSDSEVVALLKEAAQASHESAPVNETNLAAGDFIENMMILARKRG